MAIPAPQPELSPRSVRDWLVRAQAKISKTPLTPHDLAELAGLIDQTGQLRQRLLYMHTSSPSPMSHVMSSYLVEPVPGGNEIKLVPDCKFAYNTVHEAMLDGWQVIRFPEYHYPVLDREIDVPGHQFVLQKLEAHHG